MIEIRLVLAEAGTVQINQANGKDAEAGQTYSHQRAHGIWLQQDAACRNNSVERNKRAFCLALNRAVGGKSKSGAMTITSIIAINNKLTTLAQRFIVTTRDNSMFRHMLIIKYREAGQPWHACIALASL